METNMEELPLKGKDCVEGERNEFMSTQIIRNCLGHVLKNLETSVEEIPAEYVSTLKGSLVDAEKSAMEIIRPQFDHLQLFDKGSPETFQKVLDCASAKAEEAVTKELKDLEEQIKTIVTRSLNRSFTTVAENIKKFQESKVESILLQYSFCLDVAVDVFTLILKSIGDADEDFVSLEKLERVHSIATVVAETILKEKISLEPSEEVKEFLTNRLKACLEERFLEIKQIKKSDLESSLHWMEERGRKVLTDFENSIEDVFVKNTDKETTILKLNSLYVESLKCLLQQLIQIVSINRNRQQKWSELLNQIDACVNQAFQRLQTHNFWYENNTKPKLGIIIGEASRLFVREMQQFSNDFTVLHLNQYNFKADELQDSIITDLKTNKNLGSESISDIANEIKEELKVVREKFWFEAIIDKNRKGEDRIREEISTLKETFQKQVTLMAEPQIFVDGTVSTFQRNYNFSSAEMQSHFVDKLREDLLKIQQDNQNGKIAQSKEIATISETLIQEFKDKGLQHDFIHELYTEQLLKFRRAVENCSPVEQAEFAMKLGHALRDILEKRCYLDHYQPIMRFVDDLERQFSSMLHNEGYSHVETWKTDFIARVQSEAAKVHIDPKEFIQRLEEGFKISSENHGNQVRQQLAKVYYGVMHTYRNEMREHFRFPKYMSPRVLQELNEKALQTAMTLCPTVIPCNAEVIIRLKKELDEAFEEFKSLNSMNFKNTLAVGIHLGNTNSSVAVYNKEIQVIPDSLEKSLTPSYVHYSKEADTVIVGEAAVILSQMLPTQTVDKVKSLIWINNSTDYATELRSKKWPVELVYDEGTLGIQVNDKKYLVEEILAEILRKLKDYAEDFLKQTVQQAVLTVPFNFTDNHKAVMKKAGALAGLTILDFISEPVAAAVACDLQWNTSFESVNGLVYHLGGETFSVAVFTASKGIVNVSLREDLELGGSSFDLELLNYCVVELKNASGKDLLAEENSEDPVVQKTAKTTLLRLKSLCESLKIQLTDSESVTLAFGSILDGQKLELKISRRRFESMISSYFDKTMKILEDVLNVANMTHFDIDNVVLTGGSTKIPFIKDKLGRYFYQKTTTIHMRSNPDELVTMGAAYTAAVLNGRDAEEKKRFGDEGGSGAAKRIRVK